MKTRDLSLASLLCSCDYTMTNYTIDPLSGAFWFHFEDGEALECLAKNYYLGTAMVNAARFQASTKMLKTLIYRKVKHESRFNTNTERIQ